MTTSPAPWRTIGCLVVDAKGTNLGMAYAVKPPATFQGNVRLMAAAPELLAALKETTRLLGMVSDFGTASGGEHPDLQNQALVAAGMAIGKAEGA
jgi:hypothetical protein